MAEVTRRSFDLKSWQGLTEVLKVARESHLSPTAYAEFRNLVLEYAQQKGTDANQKKKIDAIIASFDESHTRSTETANGGVEKREPDRLGRRIIPKFVPRTESRTTTRAPELPVPPPPEPAPVVPQPQVSSPLVPAQPEPVTIPPASPLDEVSPRSSVPKSVDEHRARIMEVKRRVNTLVKNPVTLVDHGNQIGREYMMALLGALKATNPGATYNLEEAMVTLEDAFTKIVEYASHPHDHENGESSVLPLEPVPSPVLTPVQDYAEPLPRAVEELVPLHVPEPNPIDKPSLAPESVPETVSEPEPVPPPPEPAVRLPDIPLVSDSATSQNEVQPLTIEPEERIESKAPLTEEEARWSEEGGDADIEEQIQTLREHLKAVETVPNGVRTGKRSLIPSLLDLEEGVAPATNVAGTDWDPYSKRAEDELSPAALTKRPTSTMTGITLDTPQSELVSPDVTMALTELLHEWKIFRSSGLFGMGPGGLEHPLYIRISKLPMGEVIAGRFDDVDMKVVHSIKDYVDAWRHEQGVAYNPGETFEHYLRRVAQRILRRQSGVIDH